MRIVFTLLIFFISTWISGQTLRHPVSAPYIGLGAYTSSVPHVFSIKSNQAALARIDRWMAGVYGERRFMLQQAGTYSAVLALPTSQGNFGIVADYFGYKAFNESQLGLAYARRLGPMLDVGIQFNYYSFSIPAYQSSSAVTFEIGAIAHLTEKLSAGIHVYNPVGGRLSKTNEEKLAAVYSFGIGYAPTENFMVSTQVIKEESLPVNINAGMEYHFAKRFFARAGIITVNTTPYIGAGIRWKQMRLDITASYHQQLGISPGIMLVYDSKKLPGE